MILRPCDDGGQRIIARRAVKITYRAILSVACFVALTGAPALAQAAEQPFQPAVGQAGKDVVWVPTPHVLVEKMLDMARVTSQDFVMDLGSGDGRNIIAAAKRGARALGVEYNEDMVKLSQGIAAKEGVSDKAKFVQGDMYEADISQATVLALFLLTENLNKLMPKFIQMKPGTRIVINGFGIDGWDPDVTERSDGDCGSWCTAHLFIVPARVEGTWRLPQGQLTLQQKFQKLSGTLNVGGESMPLAEGRLAGDAISFTVNGTSYTGRVNGDSMHGNDGAWSARRQ
jgi:SAM-dependent methyltransferase